MTAAKPFAISKREVWEAYKQVKANQGAAGVDGQTIAEFEMRLSDNLYRLWNRLSSGSYFPPPVRTVEIPKASGTGTRMLGIPTVADRIAQMVVKNRVEPRVDPLFHPDSYGYRPRKSALEAVGVARARCWQYAWVLDLDIKQFFDTIPHDLLMRAVRKHVQESWVVLYIARWLQAPRVGIDGTVIPRTQGTPQGGVISPVLANLFLHYAFDAWMRRYYPYRPFERYADDIIVHCATETEARALQQALADRFRSCGLTMHPEKTKIVYCKDSNRRGTAPVIAFDFLGFTFRPRRAKNAVQGTYFTSFSPAISGAAAQRLRTTVRGWYVPRRTEWTLQALSQAYNPAIRGWMQYYGRYGRGALYSVLRPFEYALVRWAMRKYKTLRGHVRQARGWVRRQALAHPEWFAHWQVAARGGLSPVGAG